MSCEMGTSSTGGSDSRTSKAAMTSRSKRSSRSGNAVGGQSLVPRRESRSSTRPTGPRAPSLSGNMTSVVPSRTDGDRPRISSNIWHSFAL